MRPSPLQSVAPISKKPGRATSRQSSQGRNVNHLDVCTAAKVRFFSQDTPVPVRYLAACERCLCK